MNNNDDKREVLHGTYADYDTEGKLRYIGNFYDDNPVGKHIWYSYKGEVEAVYNYDTNKSVFLERFDLYWLSFVQFIISFGFGGLFCMMNIHAGIVWLFLSLVIHFAIFGENYYWAFFHNAEQKNNIK